MGNSRSAIATSGNLTKGSKLGKLSRAQRKAQNEPYYHSGSKSKARAEIKAKMPPQFRPN
jgi:hypothetical protein